MIKSIIYSVAIALAIYFLPHLSVQSQTESADSEELNYQAGMTAYMAGDYDRAQKFWVDAARNNHGRAMFNLGLLHERSYIPSASLDKAFNWYRLAGRNGYSPANFHLASLLLERNSHDQVGLQLLRRAAEQGYAPALQKSSVQRDGSDSAISKPPLMKLSSYHDSAWIETRDSSSWTIQLLAFAEVSKVKNFIEKHQLHGNAAYYLDKTSSPQLYKLILGVYPDKGKAELALKSLPIELTKHGPWLRSMASVQALL